MEKLKRLAYFLKQNNYKKEFSYLEKIAMKTFKSNGMKALQENILFFAIREIKNRFKVLQLVAQDVIDTDGHADFDPNTYTALYKAEKRILKRYNRDRNKNLGNHFFEMRTTLDENIKYLNRRLQSIYAEFGDSKNLMNDRIFYYDLDDFYQDFSEQYKEDRRFFEENRTLEFKINIDYESEKESYGSFSINDVKTSIINVNLNVILNSFYKKRVGNLPPYRMLDRHDLFLSSFRELELSIKKFVIHETFHLLQLLTKKVLNKIYGMPEGESSFSNYKTLPATWFRGEKKVRLEHHRRPIEFYPKQASIIKHVIGNIIHNTLTHDVESFGDFEEYMATRKNHLHDMIENTIKRSPIYTDTEYGKSEEFMESLMNFFENTFMTYSDFWYTRIGNTTFDTLWVDTLRQNMIDAIFNINEPRQLGFVNNWVQENMTQLRNVENREFALDIVTAMEYKAKKMYAPRFLHLNHDSPGSFLHNIYELGRYYNYRPIDVIPYESTYFQDSEEDSETEETI